MWLALHEALGGNEASGQQAAAGERQRQISTSVVLTAPAVDALTAATRELALSALYEALASYASVSDDEARSAAGSIAIRYSTT